MDADSGQILRSENADEPRYPASLTKMMTLYLTFEALRQGRLSLDESLPVSAHAASQSPTKLGVRPGQNLLARDAILGLVTQSANDAAVVLAERLGGTEENFARKMTVKAHSLGMLHTTYRNASGLPNIEQRTTAVDYAVLSRALLRDFPEDYHYFSTRQFVWHGRTFGNHNHLLENYEGTDGIKTGYTNASGFNLAASARRNGRRLITVMFGGHSAYARDRQVMALLDGGFADLGLSQGTMVARAGRPNLSNSRAPVQFASYSASRPEKSRSSRGLSGLVKDVVAPSAEAAEAEDSAPVGAWGIQVGAFSKRNVALQHATKAMRRAPNALGGSRTTLTRIRTSRGATLYRVRLMGLSEQSARRACTKLKPARIGCVTVPPGQIVASQ